MVRRLLRFFGRELKGVHEAAFLLAFAGILADILGLLRDRLLASAFGASRVLDLYYVSFRVPDGIYTLSLFFAASTALIPILLERFQEDEKKAQELLGNMFSLFGITVLVLVALAYFAIPFLTPSVAPGFSQDEQREVIGLSRILLLSPFLLGLSNLISSLIQSFRRFYIYALSPLLYNLGIIVGILSFYPRFGFRGIVWGVVLGAFLHLAVQLPAAFSLGFSLRPRFPKLSQDVIRSLKLSAPRTLGLSLNQITLTILTALGSTLGAGAVAVFNFASHLHSVPLSVIGLSYSVGAFPTLAASYLKNQKKEFLSHFSLAFRHIVFWSLPAAVLFIVLRAQIVRVILGAGAFSWVDTRLTAASLLLLSLSVLSQGLVMLLVRACYAAGRSSPPLAINFFSSVMAVGSGFGLLGLFRSRPGFRDWFFEIMRIGDISGGEVLVLPFAVLVGSVVNALLLLWYFKKIFGGFDRREFQPLFRDIILASTLMGITSYLGLKFFGLVFDLRTFLGIFLQGLFAGLLGILAGGTTLYLLKNREFQEIISIFKTKFWRDVSVVSSEPEKLP